MGYMYVTNFISKHILPDDAKGRQDQYIEALKSDNNQMITEDVPSSNS